MVLPPYLLNPSRPSVPSLPFLFPVPLAPILFFFPLHPPLSCSPPPPPRSAPTLSRMATNDRFLEAIGEKAGDDVPMDAPDAAFSDDGEVPPVVGQWAAFPCDGSGQASWSLGSPQDFY